jgi:hypothetical protein
MKPVVLYSYRDFPESSQNFSFFFDSVKDLGIPVYIAYDKDGFLHSTQFHSFDDIHFIKSDGGIDFSDWLMLLKKISIDEYSHVIFINSSCIGPVLPKYVKKSWVSVLMDLFQGDIHAIGPIIEVPPDSWGQYILEKSKKYDYISPQDTCIPFIHTYFFMLDRIALQCLVENDFFQENISKDEAIQFYERGLTALLLNKKINIRSLLYRDFDKNYLDKKNWSISSSDKALPSCPEIPGNYSGADISPFEAMFFKNLRYPHGHRDPKVSGISESNLAYIENIIKKQSGASS